MSERLRPDSPVAEKVFPSPNHGERKGGRRPEILLLHYTGMAREEDALLWLCNPVSQVSAHYFIFEDGRALQLVPEARRAWHAGVSQWDGESDVNSASIGIEIANRGLLAGLPPFGEAQIETLIRLAADIVARWAIAPEKVLGHSDVAPGRKTDPGEAFPWERLHRAGIGNWAPPAPIRDGRFFSHGDEGLPVEALQAMFALYGYPLRITGAFDRETEAVVAAFQRHFRPERIDGVADASTITTLRDVIAARAGRPGG